MTQIEHEEKATRKHFRLVVATVAAGLIAIAATAAVVVANKDDAKETISIPATVPDRSVPDPEEAARAEEHGTQRTITADFVTCATPDHGPAADPVPVEFSVLSLPLAEPLTEALFIDACTDSYGDLGDPGDRADATLCVSDDDDLKYPSVVVALHGRTCEQTVLAVDYALRPFGPADLAEVNHRRAVEVALLAVPEECATAEQTADWVAEVLDQEKDIELEVVIADGPTPEPGGGFMTNLCPFQAAVTWTEGIVTVQRPTA